MGYRNYRCCHLTFSMLIAGISLWTAPNYGLAALNPPSQSHPALSLSHQQQFHASPVSQASLSQAQITEKNNNARLECMFSHGIADTYRQAHKYVKKVITVPTIAFNYPDATQCFWRVNFWRTNLGQDGDVMMLKRALERRKQQKPDVEIILYGISRGAATIVNFMAQYERYAQAGTLPAIKAIVLESPYDDIASVAQHLAHRTYLDRIPYGHQAVHDIIGTIFVNYNKNGMSPIKSASCTTATATPCIPHHIPILIICSLEDQLVPWQSSYRLYQALRDAGNEHVHVCILTKGMHAQLLSGPEGKQYQEAVHSFYKQYGLPY